MMDNCAFLRIVAASVMVLASSGCISNSQGDSKELSLDWGNVTASWNLTSLFQNESSARSESLRLMQELKEINETYRYRFDQLTGPVLLSYLEDEKNISKSLSVLYTYAYCQNSLNVSDERFGGLLSDVMDVYTAKDKLTSFAGVKLKSLSGQEWEELFSEEPGLEAYRPYLERNYMRYSDHRPANESHAAYIADISNRIQKLEMEARKEITENVTVAGNITLADGTGRLVNYQSYLEILSTDSDRDDRKKCYDRFFYHLINQSDKMAGIYLQKAHLDDLYARELNHTDAYHAKMFDSFLAAEQVEEMNSAFKERKGDFDAYYQFRQRKLGLDRLKPYDLYLQLSADPNKLYDYDDVLKAMQGSYSKMGPAFNEAFVITATSSSIDVYPNPEGGKQIGGYCISLYPLKSPSLIFYNYRGTLIDELGMTHEMGHAINDYLMEHSVDYLYCGGTEYELEVASTFNEELFLDYVIENCDKDEKVAMLAKRISDYDNTFTRQTLITEFEHKAHILCEGRENVSAAELNALWTSLSKDYRSTVVEHYDEDAAGWDYIPHVYLANNYYTFSYALSQSITLALFKMYKEDPEKFRESYIAYLSAGTTMTPPEKLRKFFGIEIDRKLFEDAMDVVKMRVKQLEELEGK